eukprot:Phypoly_transcript_21501.p2 GENE.Phypoly_transcript_21501~~Phypoly_transcript_21501.p2  ORF type:complete len:117 (+),score=25.15 Phypoly_transcript_21501:254-604(+)
MTKIFVGRLAWKTSRDVLANYFSKYGQVTDARVISDRTTGRSKGFGFVTFADQGAADQAIKAPTHEIDGRAIVVNQANERPPPTSYDYNNQGQNQNYNQNNYANNQQSHNNYGPRE